MAKVDRRVIHDGAVYEVACAVRADAVTSPVSEFLDRLKEQTWRTDAAEAGLAPDEQVRAHAFLLATIRHFADTGEFAHWTDRRPLRDGIWEIKRLHLRLSFYDTDGAGGYTPKYANRLPMAGGGRFEIPEFDEFIRLGTAFGKTGRQTPPHELALATLIREEDLAHDRES